MLLTVTKAELQDGEIRVEMMDEEACEIVLYFKKDRGLTAGSVRFYDYAKKSE